MAFLIITRTDDFVYVSYITVSKKAYPIFIYAAYIIFNDLFIKYDYIVML